MAIYLDHAATTPTCPEALEAMAATAQIVGNPSSQHGFGREALTLLDAARDQIADALEVESAGICFTSSGTEATNLAILGRALAEPGGRILYSATEHHCVTKPAEFARELGCVVEELPVDGNGWLDPRTVESALGERASLVCVMHANNETGTIQPVEEIARICREREAVFFCDAVQAHPLLPHDWRSADLVSVAAHKFYGPKGVGALRITPGVKLHPMMVGGGQERDRRAGTENLVGIAGMAVASATYPKHISVAKGRDAFEAAVQEIPGLQVTSRRAVRHPGICHLTIEGVSAETALIALDGKGIAASSGAACSSGAIEPSHVLLAMGFPPSRAAEGLRFSFGVGNTVEDALTAARALGEVVEFIRRKGTL